MNTLLSTLLITCLLSTVACTYSQEKANTRAVGDSLYSFKTPSSGGTGKFYLGREIALVMGASNASWLDRASRPKEEHTDLAIEQISIAPTGVIADIGAGTGYYTFKLAPKVPKGKVLAVEIQEEMINAIIEKAKKLNNENVAVVKGGTKSPNLPNDSVDLAIMVDVYHELEYPVEMLQAIKKSLKKDGRLLLIEYKGEDPAVAIRPLHKTTVAQLNKELGANGFRLDYKGTFLPIQHYLLYKKQEN